MRNAPNQGRSPVFLGPMKALVSGREAYIRNGDGREELYDLDSDPGETPDLAGLPHSATTPGGSGANSHNGRGKMKPIDLEGRRIDQ